MKTSTREVLEQLERAAIAREYARLSGPSRTAYFALGSGAMSRAYRWWQRIVSATVAATLFIAPITVTIDQSRAAAGILAVGSRRMDDQAWHALRDLAALQIRFSTNQAQAAPIVDPNAPLVFQPTITQSTGVGGGVPVVNITAPNAAGFSLNRYQNFNIDPVGLILNNSLQSGTSLTGGNVAANPNLSGRTASVIINQVTSSGSAYASVLNGPLEVFGAPATVIIANPNGIAVQGAAFTNTIGVTLSTGTPQFLTAVGGTASDFTDAQALAYNVTGGHIQIEGNAGSNGPGAGIDGTVGSIDLIAETIGVDAPLFAGTRINLIAGDQLVTPSSSDATGTTYAASANGSANTAAAINAASGSNTTLAIDATSFGAMTAGQIQVIGTSAGLGVRLDGALAANAGNLTLSSNGDLTVGNHAAQQQVLLSSGGDTTVTGTGLGVTGYQLNAAGDVTTNGTVQSGANLSLTAGGNANLAGLQANGDATISAGGTLTSATIQTGGALTLQTQGANAGDIVLNGAITAGDAFAAQAAGNLTANANVAAGSGLSLTAGQNIEIASAAQVTAQTATLAAGQDTQIDGALASSAALNLNTLRNLIVNGGIAAGGAATLAAGQAVDVAGVLLGQATGNVSAGTDLSGVGSLAFGTQTTLAAGHDVNLGGTLLAGALQINAGDAISVNDLQATGTLVLSANGNAGDGDIALNGNTSSIGAASFTAARDILVNGAFAGADAVQLNAQRNVAISGSLQTAGATQAMTITAGGALTATGALNAGAALNASAGGTLTLAGTTQAVGDMTLTAGDSLLVSGALAGQGNGTLSAVNQLDLSGSASFLKNATLTSGGDANVEGSLQGANVAILAGNSANLNNVQANAALNVSANGALGAGDIALNGNVSSFGAATLTAARDVNIAGSFAGNDAFTATAQRNLSVAGNLTSVGNVSLTAISGNLTTTGSLSTNADLALTAGQSISLGTQQTSAIGNATLSAGQDLTLSGALIAFNGAMSAGGDITGGGATAFYGTGSLVADHNVNLSGVLEAGQLQVLAGDSATLANLQSGSTLTVTALGLDGTGDVTLNGTSSIVGATQLSAARDLNVIGTLAGGAAVTLGAQRDLNVTGGVQAASDLVLAANGNLTSSGTLNAGGNLTASAGSDLSLGGQATVAANTVLSAGQDLTLAGTLNGQGSGALSAGHDLNGNGSAAFVQAATLGANHDVSLGGLLQGGGVTVAAGNDLTLADLESTGTLTLQAFGTAGGGTITLNGTVAAPGAVNLTAAQDIVVPGSLGGGLTTNLSAQRNISVAGAIESVGDASLTASTGNLSASGGINSGGNLAITTGQALGLGASTSAIGDVTLNAGTNLTLGGTLVGNNGVLNAGAAILDVGTSSASAFSGTAALNAGGDVDLGGAWQAYALQVSAGGSATLGALTSATTIAIAASGTPAAGNGGPGDVTLNSTIAAPGALTVQAARDLTLNGTLACGALCSLSAQRNLSTTGAITASSDLTLTATSGDLSSAAALTLAGDLNATAGGNLTFDAPIIVGGDTNAAAGNTLTVSGPLTGQGNGVLTATNLGGAGALTFGGNATVSASQNTTLTGTLAAQNVQVTAGNSAGLGTVQASGTFNAIANGTAGGGDLTFTGDAVALGTLTLSAARNLVVAGATIGGADTTLQAGLTQSGNLTLTGDASAIGNLALSAQGGALNAGNVSTQGTLTASAGQALAMTGTVAANSDVALTSGGAMTLGALQGLASDAQAGTLNAGGNLDASSVSFANGAAGLQAGGAIAISGALVAGTTLNATAGNAASFGSVQAGTTLALQALGNNGAGDLNLGTVQAGDATTLSAQRDLSLTGAATAGGTFTASAGRDLTIGGALGADGDIGLSAATGNLALTGPVSAAQDLTANAAGALAIGAAGIDGNTTLTAGSAMTVSGLVLGNGTGTFTAGGDLSGAGGLVFAQTVKAASGGVLALAQGIGSGGDLTATGANGITLGALTAVGNATLSTSGGNLVLGSAQVSGNEALTAGGSITLGATQVEGTLSATAAQNLTAVGGIASGGAMTLQATNGNLSLANLSSNSTAVLTAGQALTLGGTNTVVDNLSLTGASVALSGTTTAYSGFTAVATGVLDTSAAQLYIAQDAHLSGTTINSGALLVGGALTETATQAITTSGETLVTGAATFNTGTGTYTNLANNEVLAGGPLTVNAGNIVNGAGGSLASTGTATLNATGSLTNAGMVDGLTTTLNAGGLLNNSGGTVLGTNAVTLTAASFNDANGLVIAGDPTQSGATTGNLSVTVTGASGAFDNSGGQLSAAQNASLLLGNMNYDPSAASAGGLYAGGQLSMTVASLSIAGNWNVDANSIAIDAINGFTNNGTVQSTGALSLSSNGAIVNSGQIIGGTTVNLSGGEILNAGAGLIHAGGDLDLSGAVINQGILEALGDINATGSSFDNQGATTQAQGNITLNLSGEANNIGGTIVASNNVTINAGSIVNDQAAPTGTTTTTTVITDPSLLWSSSVGTELINFGPYSPGDDNPGPSGGIWIPVTLGDLLSPTGSQNGTTLEGQFNGAYDGCQNCSLAASTPVAGSGSVTFDEFNVQTITADGSDGDIEQVWYVEPGPVSGEVGTVTLTLPTVYQTTTTQQAGASGVIAAGGSVSLAAGSLSNRGGQIGASGNVTINTQALSNGAVAPTMTNQSTDWVDPTQLTAFINAAATILPIEAVRPDSTYGPTIFGLAPGAAPTAISTTAWSPPNGLIAAGDNLNVYGGNLVNAGTLYAQNNVNLFATSVTNQGGNATQFTSQAGCAAGTSNAACDYGVGVRGEDPITNTFSYTQDNASIIAGNDLNIAAGTIANTYGNLIAGHDITITGIGSTPGAATAAQSLTNTSGNIIAGNNIVLDVSGAITNTLPPPVLVHQNYGTVAQYAGCMTAGGYKESYCEAYVDQQSGNSSIISAGNSLSIQAGSLTNIGSLITAGLNATINVAGPVVNDSQTLNAYWHSHWVQETGDFSSDVRHDTWACGSAAECTQLYGNAYTSVGGSIDPPTPVGNIAATIQAPNLTVNSGGQIVNVGNVIGQAVSLTGTSLVNGITNANVYTPTVTGSQQVISLAPAQGGLNLSIPTTVGSRLANAIGASSTSASGISYVLGGITSGLDPVTPQILLSNLPANLQPSSTLFYYSPQAEDIQLQTAALQQTGQASFVNGLSTDSQDQLSVTDQEKLVLYGNAVTYAEANDVQVGQALTQTQISQLTQPMLWYVEQTVPEPGCTATGTAACPTVTALMPQVYLPPNYSALSADGNIEANNSLTLNFGSAATGGSVTNTGTIASGGSLTVNTGTLTNQQNSVNVGNVWSYIPDEGYSDTTGTEAQGGGVISAAGQMSLNVAQLNQIGGVLQSLNPDGSTNTAATQQLVAGIMAQLGSNYTQSTVQNDLNTSFTAEGGFGVQQLFGIVAAVVATIVTYGAASEAIGATLSAESTTFATAVGSASAGLGNVALSAGIAGIASSATSQVVATGSVNWSDAFEAGAVAAITAGLTNGITYNADSPGSGVGFQTAPLTIGGSTNSLAGLAGVQTVGGSIVQAGASASGNLPEEILAAGADATISAGVQTAIEGGSFLTNLKDAGVQDAAADLAFAIGSEFNASSGLLSTSSPLYVLTHAALGCASSAALGTGCAGGAIGGATSALISPSIVSALDPSGAPLDPSQIAIVTAIATLAGGVTSGLAGANAQAGATAAENEALNNSTLHPAQQTWISQNAAAFAAYYQTTTGQTITTAQAQNMLEQTGYIINDNVAASGPGYNAVAGQYIANNDPSSLFSPTSAELADPGPLGGGSTQEQNVLSTGEGTPAPPGFRPPDYIAANGSGMTFAYGTSENLYNGQLYAAAGKANPLAPSGNLVFGYLLSLSDNPAVATDNFLNGASGTFGGCAFGLCIGLNHSFGGQTSVEFGIGSPGISGGTTVSKPIGGSQ